MAILSRVKISPQERFDLEDFTAEQASARSDSKFWTEQFLSGSNLIQNGFAVSGIGLSLATVAMTGCSLIIPQNSFDFSYFISSPTEPDVTITDADLVDGARNYLEVELATQDGTPLTKAFWDPEAQAGEGAEFNQVVNTVTDLKVNFVVSTGGFSGSPDRLPIAIIDTNGSGVIKVILDRRELYGRLAKPNDLDYEYSWGTKQDPIYTLNMSGVVGVFVAGETITIGSETATVVTGGTTTITFNEPTGVSFTNADLVTGGTSGATGTVNTILESFTGVDKSLNGQKEINDALMTEFKNIKGTRFWWEDGSTLASLKSEFLSTPVSITSTAKFKWSGTKLSITDDSLAPADSDNVAAIRLFKSSFNFYLTRQDTGQEVVTILLDGVADAGTLTLNQDGNLIPIVWDDTTSDIQTTWDGAATQPATIFGSPADGKIVITYDNPGNQVDVFVSSNTLTDNGGSVTPTLSIQQGMASDGSVTLADGELVYVDLPNPLANTTYSTVGTGATNYKVVARGSANLNENSYWLAYREGTKVFLRGLGEVEAGEAKQINDETTSALKTFLGFDPETATSVPYTTFPDSAFPGEFTSSSSLVTAISANAENINFIETLLTGNVYEEFMTVVSGAPADDNEVTGPVTRGTIVSLPLDSRNGNAIKSYVVGSGILEIYRNGNLLASGDDWSEIGSMGSTSTTIQIDVDLNVGERLTYRIDTTGGFTITGSGGTTSLQDAYNNGNTITTSVATPFTVGGSAAKVAQFNGDIGVTGVIDPTGIQYTPVASSPFGPTEHGTYVNLAGDLIKVTPSAPDQNLSQASDGTGDAASSQVTLDNNTGGMISKLTPVRVNTSGEMDLVDVSVLAQADACVGLAGEDVADGDSGRVVVGGVLRDITTSASFGDVLYVSKTGGVTTTRPAIGSGGFLAGDFVIKLGVVAKNPDNGSLKDLIVNVDVRGEL